MLQNLGIRLIPVWHYAVVVGYNPVDDEIFLRSGTQRRRAMSAARFLASWERADKWAIIVLEPGRMPANPEPGRYLSAAAAMERASPPAMLVQWMRAAEKQWPQNALVQFSLGNALYSDGQYRDAAGAYRKALSLDPALLVARNNLAHLLNEQGCADQALLEINRVVNDAAEINEDLMKTFLQTRAEIEKKIEATESSAAASCP